MSSPTQEKSVAAIERHYTVAELAELWGLSDVTITRMFWNEPGVLKFNRGGLPRLNPRKSQRLTIRIPESVAIRVHERLEVA